MALRLVSVAQQERWPWPKAAERFRLSAGHGIPSVSCKAAGLAVGGAV